MKGNEKTGELSTILGKGSVFEGKLKVEHTLRVDGKFTGDIITTDALIVGKEGNINGNIEAKMLIVGGKINGTAKIKDKIVLEIKAEFHGEMRTSKLVIDEGAIFDGRCSMKQGDAASTSARPNPASSDNLQK
ncbi:polymer-forming cytoskeletal protein [candidate division KSB1 bacterium]|nr:polymer-forming cytoskeletal protein [candidate division KSB1 bacterium]